VQLEESKAYYFLNNLSKARAALTSARTVANSKYVPPKTQAALDMQSGILHAADEKDFKTAFSYFFEAFEGYDSINDTDEAIRALKYMLLSKIMLDVPDEISGILAGKTASKYSAVDLEAMRAVADSAKKRSLADFNQSFKKYQKELQMDPVVSKHFRLLSDNMLEKDLSRVVQPYSYVQLSHIATCVGLDKVTVEKKLAQMILDKKLSGSLHQDEREGMMLIVYEVTPPDTTYKLGTDTIHALSEVIDGLYVRAKKLKSSGSSAATADNNSSTAAKTTDKEIDKTSS